MDCALLLTQSILHYREKIAYDNAAKKYYGQFAYRNP